MKSSAQPINRIAIPVFSIILISCSQQEVDTVNIFEEETLDPSTAVSYNLEGLGKVYANIDRVEEIENDVQIKGSIFTYNELGDLVTISSGDFMLSDKEGETYNSFDGYGLGSIPEIGVLAELQSTFDPGSYYSYATGAEIKTLDENAPLQDNRYYFDINVEDNLAAEKVITIGSSAFKFEHLYLDANDPSIFIKGDAKFSENIEIKDLGIGLSANGLLEFNPYEYSDELTSQIVKPMETMHGNIYFTGLIPIKKYSIEIYGEAIIGFVLNDNGFKEFFEDGFENASYNMGVNGKVFINNDLMNFLPSEPIEIGKATLILNIEEGNNYIQVAGETRSTEVIAQIISENGGETLSDILSFQETIMESYFYIGDDLENTKLYFHTITYIEIPEVGTQELSEATLALSAQDIYAAGKMSMPGVGFVVLEGTFGYDGQFTLTGAAEASVDLKVAELKLALEFTVSNQGVKIKASGSGCFDPMTNGEFTSERLDMAFGSRYMDIKVSEVNDEKASGSGYMDLRVNDSCVTASVEIELDWKKGSMKVCAEIPGFGTRCSTIQ